MKKLEFNKKPLIMGILNVTPDSFSDGGKFFSLDKAVKHAIQMEKEGADIIDIGGESTRPGARPISVKEEMNRVIPVVEKLIDKIKIPISIDTYKSKIAQKTLDLGASMINDITALRGDEKLSEVVAEYDVPICLMHMKGAPQNMQVNPEYDDVVEEIKDFLKERSEYAISKGIKKKNIIVDPGLGFGKRTGKGVEDNLEILNRLRELTDLGYPVMIGASRKTFIGNFFGDGETLPVSKRLEGSLATAIVAIVNGANIIRVHDVKETRHYVDIINYGRI